MKQENTPLFNTAFDRWYRDLSIDFVLWERVLKEEFSVLQNDQRIVAIAYICDRLEEHSQWTDIEIWANKGIALAANYEPGYPIGWFEGKLCRFLGSAYFHAKEWEKAKSAFVDATVVDPSSCAFYMIYLAEVCIYDGSVENAIEYTNQLVKDVEQIKSLSDDSALRLIEVFSWLSDKVTGLHEPSLSRLRASLLQFKNIAVENVYLKSYVRDGIARLRI